MTRLPTLALVVLLLLTSCSSGPDRCSTDRALLEDNFNDTACGWDEYDEPTAWAGYDGNEYVIEVHTAGSSAIAVPGGFYQDTAFRAETRLESGSEDNNYGLLCRFQDMDNFYAFLISSDGYYAITKVIGGAPYKILSGDGLNLMPSEVIVTGQDIVNQIEATCAGDVLTLRVNGEQLASVQDDELEAGDIGFIVSTYAEAPTQVSFDNVLVQEPAAPRPESE